MLNNVGEFTSQAFDNDCLTICINIEHLLPNIYMHSGLVEYLIQYLKLLTRLLIMNVKLPLIVWAYAISHVTSLIRVCPKVYHEYFLIQIVGESEFNVFHPHVFRLCHMY